jgi:hypothetical protein
MPHTAYRYAQAEQAASSASLQQATQQLWQSRAAKQHHMPNQHLIVHVAALQFNTYTISIWYVRPMHGSPII